MHQWATPVVAAAAALVRQYFIEGFYPTGVSEPADGLQPSGALVKAVMLNGADNMEGFTEVGLPIEPAPSCRQGYGRLNLARALHLQAEVASPAAMQVYDQVGIETGQKIEYCLHVASATQLRATLAWYDRPSLLSAATNLVNDLDLILLGSGDIPLQLGNLELEADRLNTVERLDRHLDPGLYALRVEAHRVPIGSQEFALVITGDFKVSQSGPGVDCFVPPLHLHYRQHPLLHHAPYLQTHLSLPHPHAVPIPMPPLLFPPRPAPRPPPEPTALPSRRP
ncbi:hypothetical protein CYMTET_31068 [Cymbomonas tetramitiformis]|uniref:Subtilisin n=1 Tax=Cymbomonas tetramitiformis TaxID=36881 RepID=A0AAE0FHP5_9CHLO|nr:hypothetical protein CYMTET_31068 [Cymbomonas tetramitiformis]